MARSAGDPDTLVRVRRCPDLSADALDSLVRRLPPVERSRVDTLLRREDRLASALGWVLMQDLTAGRGAALRRGPDGRPRTDPPLDVSMSHSGGWVAAALSEAGRVGIDLETVRAVPPSLLRRCLSPPELSWVDEVPAGAARHHRFFRLWTAKEAFLKATGVGLGQDPRTVGVDCSGAAPALLGELAGSWTLTSTSPAKDVLVTVCAERAA